jgi:hypothetical protein
MHTLQEPASAISSILEVNQGLDLNGNKTSFVLVKCNHVDRGDCHEQAAHRKARPNPANALRRLVEARPLQKTR